MKEIRENFTSLINYWDSYLGLFVIIASIFSMYWGFAIEPLNSNFENKELFVYLIIPLVIITITYLIWAYKSNRINLYKKRRITTGLFFTSSDFNAHVKIKEIIKEMIIDIEDEFPDIKLKLFPLNYLKTEKSLKKYIESHDHVIDNAFFAKIHYGNCINDSGTFEKIEIQNLIFTGKFNELNSEDFRTKIIISEDLRLRNLNKNWEYFESRSFDDKQRVKRNLKDSLLFFVGLYLIYMKEQDIALQVFKYLKNIEESNEELDELLNSKKNRLNDILLNLFTFTAIKKYIKNKDTETAFRLLKECEEIFKDNHRFTVSNFITLARIYYEKGNVKKAYEYTDKAYMLGGDSAATHCNYGFFGLIENNIDKVHDNYKQLAHVYKFKGKVNYVEIIHFLDIHKSKYEESKVLFEFAIAALNFLYVDKKMGEQKLFELKKTVNDNAEYVKIFNLINHFLTKGEFKSTYYRRDKSKNK